MTKIFLCNHNNIYIILKITADRENMKIIIDKKIINAFHKHMKKNLYLIMY